VIDRARRLQGPGPSAPSSAPLVVSAMSCNGPAGRPGRITKAWRPPVQGLQIPGSAAFTPVSRKRAKPRFPAAASPAATLRQAEQLSVVLGIPGA